MTTKCEVCNEVPARYKCPGCLVETCSVPCVKKHKDETKCSGRRDRTAYVPMRDFSDLDLLNDYRFLEEAHRKTDSAQNNPSKRQSRPTSKMEQLKRVARCKDISLKFMPEMFARRHNNRTTCDKKKNTIDWHLELNFPKAEAQYEGVFSEKMTLQEVLKGYIDPVESDPVIRQKLQVFTTRWPQAYIFMKVENCPVDANRYCELDLNKTIMQNIKRKCVIEYPILYIVMEEEVDKYRTEVNKCTKRPAKFTEDTESTADTDSKKSKNENSVVDGSVQNS